MKIQFGHGGHILEGWINLEQHQADITKPLTFENGSVDFILCEHVLEHVTPQQGYRFLLEAHRILKPEGVIRVIVPDIVSIWNTGCGPRYLGFLKEGIKTWWPSAGLPAPADGYEPTDSDAVMTLIFCHGHKALYSQALLSTIMESIGYDTEECDYLKSRHSELNKIDSHWKYMGLENCVLESCVVEGTKNGSKNHRSFIQSLHAPAEPDAFHYATGR